MLNQYEVDAEEERLRERVNALPDERRKAFYDEARRALKDPDTYAVLNWFFLAGLHHFYLGRWQRGMADLALLIAGIMLFVSGQPLLGLLPILTVVALELWALFRSQVIVQDWNNEVYRRLLAQHEKLKVMR